MEGGLVEVDGVMVLGGTDIDTGRAASVECPVAFYDAPIGVECILSYGWLAKHGIDVRCKRHGLEVAGPSGPIWVPGIVYAPLSPQAQVSKLPCAPMALCGVILNLGQGARGQVTP